MAIAHTPAKPWLSMDEATHCPWRTSSHLVRARAPAEATPTRRGRKRACVTVQPAGSGSAPSETRCCEVSSVPGVQFAPTTPGCLRARSVRGRRQVAPRPRWRPRPVATPGRPGVPGAHSQGPAHSPRPLALRSLARLTGPPCGPSGMSAVCTEP